MSMLFTPFYLPFIGLVALFLFSYLSIFPWPYKLQVLTMVYLFTILMPWDTANDAWCPTSSPSSATSRVSM